ncbi:hypothetical protein NIES2104_06360 [Leptolyngbya sp. NIES-2104]|nr:hypothetical protein NIES2104_06360 [Leptolyngbya sp. NIES-2104]
MVAHRFAIAKSVFSEGQSEKRNSEETIQNRLETETLFNPSTKKQ